MSMRMLVAYCMQSTHVETAWNYLSALKRYSVFDVEYMHVTYNVAFDVDIDKYDVVFQDYHARLCRKDYVTAPYQEKMRAFSGVKVMAVQDEYDNTNTLKAAVRALGFDVVLTCVPQDSIGYVYPRAEFPDVTFATVLTGYVPEWYVEKPFTVRPLAERPIVVGYRTRNIGGRYGRLGFEKFEIGRRMKEICDARGIPNDITMDEESRIYGPAWFDFIGQCRAMLGTESGSNVFDFDSTIAATYKKMTQANGGRAPSYEEFRPFVEKRDNEISMGQISPRIFECALMRTPMILFRGRYSDALNPDEHYIPLEKDFSNVAAVLEKLDDIAGLESMAARAYRHLIGSGRFNYRRYVEKVDELILRQLELKRGSRSRTRAPVEIPLSLVLDDLPTLNPEERSALKRRLGSRRFEAGRFLGGLKGRVRRPLARLRHGGAAVKPSNIHPLLINSPTPNPLRQEFFYLRHEHGLSENIARENDRIAILYKEHIGACGKHLDALAAKYRNERAHLEASVPSAVRQLPPVPEAALGAAALEPLRAAYSEFEALRLTRRAKLNRDFLTALDAVEGVKALAMAQEILRQEVEDEKANNAHYRKMSDACGNFREKTQAAIDAIRARIETAEKAMAERVTPAGS
jgi:hypothetical protein